jgi:hypothetical protein
MRILVIDDQPAEWIGEARLLSRIQTQLEASDLPINVSVPYRTGQPADGVSGIHFGCVTDEEWRTCDERTNPTCDVYMFDLSLAGTNVNNAGAILAQQFCRETRFQSDRVWIVSSNNPEVLDVIRGYQQTAIAKSDPIAIAVAILKLLNVPSRPLLPTELVNYCILNLAVEKFFHNGLCRGATAELEQAINVLTNEHHRVVELDTMKDLPGCGVAALEVNSAGGAVGRTLVSGYEVVGDTRCVALRQALLDKAAVVGIPADIFGLLDSIQGSAVTDVTLLDVLFPRVHVRIPPGVTSLFSVYLQARCQLVAPNLTIDWCEVPRELARTFKFETIPKATVPLSFMEGFDRNFLGDMFKYAFNNNAGSIRVGAFGMDGQRAAFLLMWHQGLPYPNKDTMLLSCRKLFPETCKYAHTFVASRLYDGWHTIEVLPGLPDRELRPLHKPTIDILGSGAVDFALLGQNVNAAYLFIVPTFRMGQV